MTKLAMIPERILIRKGMAEPMAATGPLVRASGPGAIDWQSVANRRAPVVLPAARARRRTDPDGRARARREPRVRISLRLDQQRHARFKAFCTLVRRTQQGVLLQALDELFARHGLDEAAGDRRKPLPE